MKKLFTFLFFLSLCSSVAFLGCSSEEAGDDDDDVTTPTGDDDCDYYEEVTLLYGEGGEAEIDTTQHLWEGVHVLEPYGVTIDMDTYQVEDQYFICYLYSYTHGSELPPQENCPEDCTSSWDIEFSDSKYDEDCDLTWIDIFDEVIEEEGRYASSVEELSWAAWGNLYFGLHEADDYWLADLGYHLEDLCPECNVSISLGNERYGWFSEYDPNNANLFASIFFGILDDTVQPNTLQYSSLFWWITNYYYDYCVE